ncbi:hypothetical protein DMN91_005406 [Ooceraea biroi]|uniref:PDZ domain-containing protein n=1 Tax=Ooceraea biroi TaxID=2015173 RepID=A0A3L8DTN9_OOCBI|nr:uncharacterized protein LOC105287577 [Ooceraea biroi]RLU23128.1 hypothetical protein DMN91_005406 [Ooceraea biroi]
MKNAHPIVNATASGPVGPDSTSLDESAEPVIRLKVQKPLHWEWELTTSADALPVIQLLDKDGRLLVETTGRTAQRARGSFKEGLRSHEQFSVDESGTSSRSKTEQTSSPSTSSASTCVATVIQGNRNIDGFSSKFGTCNFAPRKSRSDINIKENRGSKGKRHSSEDPKTRKTKSEKNVGEGVGFKNYSAGDYLRQQIMDDLRTRSTIGKTTEEIAKNRCRKVKAYLRSRSENLLSLVREEECSGGIEDRVEIGSRGRNLESRDLKRSDTVDLETKRSSRDSEAMKPYLRTRSTMLWNEPATMTNSETNEVERVVRKIKDDMNEEELVRIRAFLREKIQRRMNMEQALVRAAVPETLGNAGIRKRYSDYVHEGDRRNYRTRKVRSETNILRFDPEVLARERLKASKQSEKEKPTTSCKESSEDSLFQRQLRNYRRSRSEVLREPSDNQPGQDDRSQPQLKRQSSSVERKKIYRKTKSDVLLGQAAAAAINADNEQQFKDLGNPPRRIKSQENVERSWREYKERKRSERLHRGTGREVPEEDDFMNKPRWKDLQRDLCSSRNCKVCQNLRNCVDPLHERDEKRISRQEAEAAPTARRDTVAKVPEDETSSNNSGSRPGTSLQENYLLMDERDTNGLRSPIVGKIRAKNRDDEIGINSPDFGYNTILPKSVLKDYRELYARSNVKKSDTFKIVDGSENPEEHTDDCNSTINGSDGDLGYLNGVGSLANKSNEDITRDYFKRVYELLKRRQEEARRVANGSHEIPTQGDSSSSNYVEEVQRRKHRRRRKDKSPQGEEVVTVPSTSSTQEGWKVQRLSVNGDSQQQSSNRRRSCSNRSQLQPVPVSGGKRNRPAPPPPSQPVSCRVSAKDQVDSYFVDWPNKENTPGNAVNRCEDNHQANHVFGTIDESTMGSNLSRHSGKGLTGRRTQSSGNLCDPKGKLNSMGKILVPCSSAQRERYKFCGSLPNHLDDKDDDQRDNNNMSETSGSFGGTLPHKKRSLGVHFSDSGPTGTLDLVKHRSQDSLDENDPWRYQQSDLDLVRCRHGNFDSVKRNRSADTVLVDSGRRYGRGVSSEDRCQRNSDLDLVGTLPKRKQDARNSSGRSLGSNSSSSQPCIVNTATANVAAHVDDDDLLMKLMHKPDCELLKHRQQFGKCPDLKLNKLMSGEPQDQGYASERSPEDEHPPSLPGQPFPNVTPENTFRVILQKSSRGLGLSVSGGGTAGPVRVKRLFPQQPAAMSNKLQIGDILLAANGVPLTGLTNYEALEVLRTTPSTVELVVCRLPGDSNVTPPGAPPPPPARREPSSLRLLNPLPPLQIEPCGEFDIEMTKVGGSLGFTLRKVDSSALGHYVRALVREPALSDGRIQPGDKIVAVDGAPLSPMSHEEAVQLLRQCGPTVKLRLYRDLAQTPVSALSPTEPDHPLRPPRTSLRQEAVDMLCDLAVRKLSPGTSSGSSSCKQQSPGASCNSPRRLRRLATRTPTAEMDQEISESKLHDVRTSSSTASQAETTSDSDQCSVRTQITNSQANTPATDIIIDPPPLYVVCDDDGDGDGDGTSRMTPCNATVARPRFLDLSAPQGKPHFQFCSVDSDGEYPGEDVILAEAERSRLAEPSYNDDRSVTVLSSDEHDNDLPSEPASMPPVLSSTSSTSTAAFSYKNPAYQSANPACGGAVSDPAVPKSKATHSSDQDIPGKILGTDDPAGSKGLLKWKGVMFAPNDEVDQAADHDQVDAGRDTTDSVVGAEDVKQDSEVFMVELTRGWNSRLGFSLQPEGNRTVISVVHPDSVAAKDGRLKQGDVLLMVNEESVEHMSTADIIDLLRKIRGSIGITVMRKSKRENVT